MPESNLTVKVKLFAAYQEAYGLPEITLNFPEQIRVKFILNEILKEHPELEKWKDVTRFGINLNFVDENTLIKDKDEIVLIPPVSGG